MIAQFLGFFQGVWTSFLDDSQLDKVLAIFSLTGISITSFFVGGRGNRQKLRQAEKRVGELQKEAELVEKKAEAKIVAAQRARDDYYPTSWLVAAERERKEGNEVKAIDLLDVGYQRVRGELSQVIEQLARHHSSLVAGLDWEGNLADAKRLAQSSHLLDPTNPGGRALLEELSVVDEQLLEDLEPIGSRFLPTEPLLASRMVQQLSILRDNLFTSGNYQICVALMRRADLICRRNPAIADNMRFSISHRLAQSLQFAGQPKLALDTVRSLLPQQKKVSGPENHDTLTAHYLEASILQDLGECSEALDAVRSLLPVQEKVSGPENHDTLSTRSLEASILWDLGKCSEALDAVRKLLPVQEKVSGPEHPDTLWILSLEATILRDRGECSEALHAIRSLLPVQEKVSGPEHPATLMARYLEASILRSLGECGEALEAIRCLLSVQEKVSGPENPLTYRVKYLEAKILFDLSESADALARVELVLRWQKEKLGPMHRHTKESAELVQDIRKSGS